MGRRKELCGSENKELTLNHVEELFRKRRAEISSTICKNCVEHVKHVEESYWKTDRIVDAKLDKLEIALDVNDNDEGDLVNQMKRMIRCFIKLFCQSTVIDLKNFNAKTHPYLISLGTCSCKF